MEQTECWKPSDVWDLSSPQREQYQKRLFLRQLRWVTQHVPFYRDLNLAIPELEALPLQAILDRLPFQTKNQIKGKNPQFLADMQIPGYWVRTGGSTGERVDVFHEKTKVASGKASTAFARGWWGFKDGQKCFYIWGHSGTFAPGWKGLQSHLLGGVKDRLLHRLRVNAYTLDEAHLQVHIDTLIKFQPKWILGYTSSVFALAQSYIRNGHHPSELTKLRGVIVTSDPCYPYQLDTINTAFRRPVINEYGCIEFGCIAYTHPDGTYRVLEDHLIIETPMVEDQRHDVVVTDLCTRFQPFIRYKLDDHCSMPLADPPSSGFHTIGEIEGRLLDFVIGKNGQKLHGLLLSHFVTSAYPLVSKYRFYQNKSDKIRVELQLFPNKEIDHESEEYLLSLIRREIGSETVLEVVYVNSFPQTPSGKFRWVVSELN